MIGRLFRYFDELSLIAIGLLLFLIASNTQTGWVYLLSGSVFGGLLSGAVYSRRSLRPAGFRLRVPPRVEAGQAFSAILSWDASSPSYPTFWKPSNKEAAAEQVGRSYVLIPVRERSARFQLTLGERGVVEQVPGEILCFGPVGWFWSSRNLAPVLSESVLVLPRALAVSERQLDEWASGAFGSRRGQPASQGDLRRLRDYQVGDDVRWVHWASSARTGKLVVREFSQGGAARMVLCFGVHPQAAEQPGAQGAFEWMLSWVYSYFLSARRLGWDVQIQAFVNSSWQSFDSPDILATAQCGPSAEPPNYDGLRVEFWVGQRPMPCLSFVPEDYVQPGATQADGRWRIGPGQQPLNQEVL